MDFREQWEKVDVDLFKSLIKLHNDIVMERKKESDFDDFVLSNKERLNNPDYLQIFAERVEILDEYFEEHYEMCKFFYDFMKDNEDWCKLDFSLRTYMRLGLFEDSFEEYLNQKKTN